MPNILTEAQAEAQILNELWIGAQSIIGKTLGKGDLRSFEPTDPAGLRRLAQAMIGAAEKRPNLAGAKLLGQIGATLESLSLDLEDPKVRPDLLADPAAVRAQAFGPGVITAAEGISKNLKTESKREFVKLAKSASGDMEPDSFVPTGKPAEPIAVVGGTTRTLRDEVRDRLRTGGEPESASTPATGMRKILADRAHRGALQSGGPAALGPELARYTTGEAPSNAAAEMAARLRGAVGESPAAPEPIFNPEAVSEAGFETVAPKVPAGVAESLENWRGVPRRAPTPAGAVAESLFGRIASGARNTAGVVADEAGPMLRRAGGALKRYMMPETGGQLVWSLGLPIALLLASGALGRFMGRDEESRAEFRQPIPTADDYLLAGAQADARKQRALDALRSNPDVLAQLIEGAQSQARSKRGMARGDVVLGGGSQFEDPAGLLAILAGR